VRPQPFQVLQVLVEHAGDVVTREEFRRILWPAESFVDFEQWLDAAAKALEWVEVDCQSLGTARRFRDDQVLKIGVGMVPDRWYRVRIRADSKRIRENGRSDCEG
jgi:hypothetical protein